MESTGAASSISVAPSLAAAWKRPLPYLDTAPGTRVICRLLAIVAVRHIRRVDGIENVLPERDPFILAVNHTQWAEALIVPAFLIHQRDGRMIHFLADWNFLLVPLVATAFRASGTIVVGRKSARPRVLNALRSRLVPAAPPFERAAAVLAEGRSVGIFPEGTTNRNPGRLLAGDSGAARLSLAAGVPVVPAGIRFPGHTGAGPVGALEPLELHIGSPLQPPRMEGKRDSVGLRAWHAELMGAIALLSGKSWEPRR